MYLLTKRFPLSFNEDSSSQFKFEWRLNMNYIIPIASPFDFVHKKSNKGSKLKWNENGNVPGKNKKCVCLILIKSIDIKLKEKIWFEYKDSILFAICECTITRSREDGQKAEKYADQNEIQFKEDAMHKHIHSQNTVFDFRDFNAVDR